MSAREGFIVGDRMELADHTNVFPLQSICYQISLLASPVLLTSNQKGLVLWFPLCNSNFRDSDCSNLVMRTWDDLDHWDLVMRTWDDLDH